MYSWNKTRVGDKDVLTVFIEGQPKTISSDSVHFEEVKRALLAGDWVAVGDTIDKTLAITRKSNGLFEIVKGSMIINGEKLPKTLGNKIVELYDGGWPFEPFVKFWENLLLNPSNRAVECLYDFLSMNPETSFTQDGCFIAYKGVGVDFMDLRTSTMDNSPGKIVSMPRNKVNEDPNVTCSHGLHAAAWGYASGTVYGHAEHYVMIKINPRDVVAVPIDYNFQKMRVCEYLVLKEIDSPIPEGQHYVSNLGDEFEDDEFEDDEFEDDEFEDNDMKDYNYYKECVSQNSLALPYVPEELKTEEMCKIAVTKNGFALYYVPDHLKNKMEKK